MIWILLEETEQEKEKQEKEEEQEEQEEEEEHVQPPLDSQLGRAVTRPSYRTHLARLPVKMTRTVLSVSSGGRTTRTSAANQETSSPSAVECRMTIIKSK